MGNCMHITRIYISKMRLGVTLSALTIATLGGCGGEGPAIQANPQTISFAAAPTPPVDQTNVTVSATASSGLPVRYTSITRSVCSVESSTGVVTGLKSGTCTIAANQPGNTQYAPAPQVTRDISFSFSHTLIFAPVPPLSLYDRATVTAVDSSGLTVTYASDSPAVCTVAGDTGLVTALATGNCAIAASAGALQATQSIAVSSPAAITVPGAPTGVSATAGDAANSIKVSIGGTVSGGRPITGYTVNSIPIGITGTGSISPITVTCPSSCAGYAFTVTAANDVGSGPSSAVTDVITRYKVLETFHEPDTQPNDSIFIGSFTLNSTTGTISGLHGILSESMTGGSTGYPNDSMTWLSLNNQLVSWHDSTLGGTFAAVFKNANINTFSTMLGGDGWSPQAGVDVGGIYYGFPTAANNPGNSYALIFVPDNPLTTLTQAQINKLAYADCAPGGMMGAVCMTGTSVAGYGSVGTMSGYPVSQVITRQ